MFNNFLWGALPKPKLKAKYKNAEEFQCWYRKLCNMAMSIYKWENLPDSCDHWIIEYALLMYGKVCIAKDEKYGIISLPCQETQMYNIYGYSDSVIAYGFNGFNKTYKCYMQGADNKDVKAVMMYDNPSRFPYIAYIINTAERLSDTIRAIDVAVHKLKNPYWITCSQKQIESVKKTLSQVADNENAVITAKTLTPDEFQILPTSSNPNILNGLWDNYNNTYDIIKEILGINNNQQSDKKERLITDEVNSNNFITEMFLNLRLKQREEFCERVNKTFDLDIRVGLNESFEEFKEMLNSLNDIEEGDNDEPME